MNDLAQNYTMMVEIQRLHQAELLQESEKARQLQYIERAQTKKWNRLMAASLISVALLMLVFEVFG